MRACKHQNDLLSRCRAPSPHFSLFLTCFLGVRTTIFFCRAAKLCCRMIVSRYHFIRACGIDIRCMDALPSPIIARFSPDLPFLKSVMRCMRTDVRCINALLSSDITSITFADLLFSRRAYDNEMDEFKRMDLCLSDMSSSAVSVSETCRLCLRTMMRWTSPSTWILAWMTRLSLRCVSWIPAVQVRAQE